jgi:hypothetical protein
MTERAMAIEMQRESCITKTRKEQEHFNGPMEIDDDCEPPQPLAERNFQRHIGRSDMISTWSVAPISSSAS